MKQQRTDARSLTADQQKRIEEVCFRSLALIGHNCEYLEQHFDRTGADESTRQAVADINAAAVKLDRTLSGKKRNITDIGMVICCGRWRRRLI